MLAVYRPIDGIIPGIMAGAAEVGSLVDAPAFGLDDLMLLMICDRSHYRTAAINLIVGYNLLAHLLL